MTIDFAGFSGETLNGALAEPLDKVRDGRLRPESLQVRILVPDPNSPWTLPARVDDLADSPAFRERAARIMERHTTAIVEAVTELGELGLIAEAHAEVRVSPAVPLFKLYVINGTEAFFGYYPVQEHTVRLDGEPTPMWDLMGKDTVLFHHSGDTDPDSIESQYLAQSQMWFTSMWDTVARQPTHTP